MGVVGHIARSIVPAGRKARSLIVGSATRRAPPRRRSSTWIPGLLVALLPIALAVAQSTGGSYTLRKVVVAGGGVDSAAGPYTLVATAGQPIATVHTGGNYRLTGGFHGPVAPRADRILCDSFESTPCP